MNNDCSFDLEPSWQKMLGGEFSKPYMHLLKSFLNEQLAQNKIIYPECSQWFNAFNASVFDQVKVVILGQDPYHGPGQAHGLCFSVQQGLSFPPSLLNIFKELETDIGMQIPFHGCLQSWAERGVLLLNTTLTVEQGKAGSHQRQGWEQFTDCVIQSLNDNRENLVFILWGSYAQKKAQLVDRQKHCVLTAPHPSPLSSYRGFFGSRPFSKTNEYLVSKNLQPVDWSLD